MNEDLKDKASTAIQLTNIGTVYHDQKNYQKALDYFFRALKIDEELGDKTGIATDLGNIGSLYTSIKKYDEAEKYLLQAVAISDTIFILKEKMQFENSLSELYSQTGNTQKAFEHFKKAMEVRDTLINQEKSRKIMNFEFEKKETAIKAENEKKMLIAEENRKKQVIIIWFISGCFVLVIFFTVLLFKRWRKTQKQKKIIEYKKQEVETKNKIIEEKNKKITDSIKYAKLIQDAVLPGFDKVSKFSQVQKNMFNENNSFVLFKPKDIVSGDFYWATHINEWFIFTVADCTGHGIPGAFMSMLGISFLNEIVRKKEVTRSSEVLNHLRNSIIDALQQKGQWGEQKDGMDMALCALNTSNNSLQYAGANNPLFIVRASGELNIVEPDKQPVAIYEEMIDFTNKDIELNTGDCIYLTSDGYQDQFGGPNNRKFMVKQLKELFVSIARKTMAEQRDILNRTF
jgi:serine phosphatase RsbU (regulator of sigma subunit)